MNVQGKKIRMSVVTRHCEIHGLGSREPRLKYGIRLDEPHIASRNGYCDKDMSDWPVSI